MFQTMIINYLLCYYSTTRMIKYILIFDENNCCLKYYLATVVEITTNTYQDTAI